ncbi:hypothetical protein PtA15_9A665 [Puccinia triticina]|uniref:Transmembrane protein n=1 Tax=Puccinia triticina TaxID=208348 RepID=A0ABY7CTC5_9BASI|nr:uncharacterized protein PtA15_9A665 [Puccinia triticina]WAQ88538.1 hypothetical protein PtA15_9A665 [Puccinia triticina]
MLPTELVQHQKTIQTSSQHLLFLLSLSLLTIYTFTWSRWNLRLGLDQLHLIQLILIYFFSQRFSSQGGAPSGTTSNEKDRKLNQADEKMTVSTINSRWTIGGGELDARWREMEMSELRMEKYWPPGKVKASLGGFDHDKIPNDI